MKKLICAVTVLAVSTAQAATIHVDVANCAGPGNGSVGDPFCSIQDAIVAAVNGNVVIVAEGEYFQDVAFLGKTITVRSTDPNDPEVVANTIIRGTGAGNAQVEIKNIEEPGTVFSGFLISGIFNRGMFIAAADPLVSNCTFFNNQAKGLPDGSGIYIEDSSATITNCTFIENRSNFGGGIFIFRNPNTGLRPTVTNCTFSGNTADFDGGGIFIHQSNLIVTNCTFTGNTSNGKGGGIYNSSFKKDNATVVTGCTFTGNGAGGGGGGIYVDNLPFFKMSNTAFCDNIPDAIFGPYEDLGSNTFLCPCPDLDGDGNVGINDFLDLLANWGSPYGINDFLDLLAAWGPCP